MPGATAKMLSVLHRRAHLRLNVQNTLQGVDHPINTVDNRFIDRLEFGDPGIRTLQFLAQGRVLFLQPFDGDRRLGAFRSGFGSRT